MSDGMSGERLASLETEIRLMRETLDAIYKTLERQADQGIRIANVEKHNDKMEAELKAFDTDLTLKDSQISALRLDHETFKAYIKARDWGIALMATIGASVGGFLLQKLVSAIL